MAVHPRLMLSDGHHDTLTEFAPLNLDTIVFTSLGLTTSSASGGNIYRVQSIDTIQLFSVLPYLFDTTSRFRDALIGTVPQV